MIFCTILTGGIINSEFELYTNNQLILIFVGCAISVTGIITKISSLEAYDVKIAQEEEETVQSDEEEYSDDQILMQINNKNISVKHNRYVKGRRFFCNLCNYMYKK